MWCNCFSFLNHVYFKISLFIPHAMLIIYIRTNNNQPLMGKFCQRLFNNISIPYAAWYDGTGLNCTLPHNFMAKYI